MFAAYYNFCWQTRKPGKSGEATLNGCYDGGIGRARLDVR